MPSSQVVSAWTLAALVARAVAVSAAVIVPLKFGVPSAWHFDAPVTTEILATTRVASVAHVVCVIATYVVWTEKSRWGIPTAGVVAATRRALAGVAVGFVVCFLAVVSLGVSSLAKPKETAHLALLVASLTCAPGAVRYGVPFTDRKIAKTWSVLLTAAGGVNDDEDDDDETTSSESKTKRKASTKTKKNRRRVLLPVLAYALLTVRLGVDIRCVGYLSWGVGRRDAHSSGLGPGLAKVAGFVRTRRGRRVGCWAGFRVSRRIRETVCAYERGEAKKNE